ncbi:2-amino-4-hydroxy-6-hydroxymethyldihydropteridine diphosphokinase [Loigolactobacillus coryniformis]|jgi:2-amino-4-hydroxy-6-hydroxymethyldihydropteridine diphosphokinase|uniref:2-amino-4-hydroxy-6-hydroxymethyldihydropteridine diphosphokinase n=1 Tax=Loigolactobacillus coryniformis TaxID=1610 RepID=A0A5B8TFZ1_9LACO|nr:2-amino-4-hydroxy-6-hydroxymethyldihydropteridine diphosphokinase [Loigolactobacillus coryniformis]MDT3391687.1 2-amino-4-hydroxy-6-hydroxymethyldihydropteridine diphosphokinase [Bacillota bacterium]RRG05151.1 MAG: 2-amino-4-hydroxy-6-hydroxymethyldihydropteridine diphosphokinase [Lactobacillus sp.]MBW4802912.1 2-amino-4-hydroxy-6-hydroxymethyldihydropteridine diphosphokinase [Loigolactobacillus coryniformis subsp. torquens]MBW4805608.1 2-amino-4-hydroxy-6-hydroxymethyldihydropteridine dipho
MHQVYLSIGSNIGDRKAQLQQAIAALQADSAIDVVRVSSIYETAPVGGVVQDDFYNCAVYLETSLSATELLQRIQQIEQNQKRRRLIHWGPRTIDLDILWYDDVVIQTADLTIPHPEMAKRAFVLVPLQEITTGQQQKQVEQLLQALPAAQRVTKIRDEQG